MIPLRSSHSWQAGDMACVKSVGKESLFCLKLLIASLRFCKSAIVICSTGLKPVEPHLWQYASQPLRS